MLYQNACYTYIGTKMPVKIDLVPSNLGGHDLRRKFV